MTRNNRQYAKADRHTPLRRLKWWLRAKWRWFKQLTWWQKTLLVGGPLIVILLIIPLLTFAYFALTMGDMEQVMNRNNTYLKARYFDYVVDEIIKNVIGGKEE